MSGARSGYTRPSLPLDAFLFYCFGSSFWNASLTFTALHWVIIRLFFRRVGSRGREQLLWFRRPEHSLGREREGVRVKKRRR